MRKYVYAGLLLIGCFSLLNGQMIYEVDDLIGLARKSSGLADHFERSMELDHYYTHFYDVKMGNVFPFLGWIPSGYFHGNGLAIDQFNVQMPGALREGSLRQGMSVFTLYPYTTLKEDDRILCSLGFKMIGNYIGVYNQNFFIFSDGSSVSVSEPVTTQVFDNLAVFNLYTPWIQANTGYIENIVRTNVNLTGEGDIRQYRFYFNSLIYHWITLDTIIKDWNIERLVVGINRDALEDWLDLKLSCFQELFAGLKYNNFYRDLAGLTPAPTLFQDLRFAFSGTLSTSRYLYTDYGIEIQPQAFLYDMSILRYFDWEFGALIPIPFYNYEKEKASNTNIEKQLAMEIGLSGGISYFSDSVLSSLGNEGNSVFGYYYKVKFDFVGYLIGFFMTYQYAFNSAKYLNQYPDAVNKPVHEVSMTVLF